MGHWRIGLSQWSVFRVLRKLYEFEKGDSKGVFDGMARFVVDLLDTG